MLSGKNARNKRLHTVQFHLCEAFRIGKFIEPERRPMLSRCWRKGEIK